TITVAAMLAWRAFHRTCQPLAVFTDSETVAASGSGPAEAVVATAASAGFFQALGVTPAIGRVWREGDDQPGVPSTSIVSYRFWMEHLRGDPAVVGRSLI